MRPNPLLALKLLTLDGNRTGVLFVFEHVELVPCAGGTVKSEHRNRRGWTRFIDALSALVEHGLDASAVLTCEHGISHAKGSCFDKHVGHVTTALVQAALHHRAQSTLPGVCHEIQHLCLEQHLFEQFVDVGAKLGRDLLTLVFSTPVLHENVHLGELLLDAVGVGRIAVHLVDRKNHGDLRSLGVVDCFLRLWHDTVIRGNHDDGQVRDLGATRTHGRKGLVTRGVEKGHFLSALQLHGVGTDVLGDAAGLTRNDVRLAHKIQQRRLPMVNVAHDRHDRRT